MHNVPKGNVSITCNINIFDDTFYMFSSVHVSWRIIIHFLNYFVTNKQQIKLKVSNSVSVIGSETHFKVVVVSENFNDKPLIQVWICYWSKLLLRQVKSFKPRLILHFPLSCSPYSWIIRAKRQRKLKINLATCRLKTFNLNLTLTLTSSLLSWCYMLHSGSNFVLRLILWP